MLIDTDVIIWYMRGLEQAGVVLENNHGFRISIVTYIELVQGMRNKAELATLRQALKAWEVKILYLSEEISSKAMFYIEQYYLSHALQLADALIAATAAAHGQPLLTGNLKHYRIIKEIELVPFRQG